MAAFARVAINVPSLTGVFIDGAQEVHERSLLAFDYSVPEALQADIRPGHLVLVPFANRTVQAVVLALPAQPAVSKTKTILQLVDPVPALTPAQVGLAEWLAARSLSSISAIIGLFLPPGLARQADTLYELTPAPPGAAETQTGRRLLQLLETRGPLRGRQIDRSLPRVAWRRTAQRLVQRGVLTAASVLPPASVRPKFVRTAELAVSPAVAQAALGDLGSTEKTRARRRKALEYLLRRPEAVNVSWVYAESRCTLADLQELSERELIVLREQEVWRDPLSQTSADAGAAAPKPAAVLLTAEQQQAWKTIQAALADTAAGREQKPLLIQGVTGSGKTELYLRAAAEVVRRGQQVILLVPEIALTPQTVQRFRVGFPGQIGLIHSGLSEGERYDTWRRARQGGLNVIIGPRSALFSPLPRLGLVVVDDCHDSSYHQADPPFYDAAAAAQAYARLCGGVCIMGSATPSVVQRHAADIGESVRIELKQRAATRGAALQSLPLELPMVRVVDMREELRAGNRSSFSNELTQALKLALRGGEQAILFLNRRGTAAHVFCRNCGFVVKCPRCDTPLTYHVSWNEKLLCHHCGYERKMVGTCPDCRSLDIRAYGLGTEKVEAEIQKSLPGVRTLRWDWETTREKGAHELILQHFANGRADILIGTQMLAKGLDLPRVTLVGIVMADVGLFLPDPFAPERVFQLLTQVAGRAGRSTRGGRVILQTFAPEHYAIAAASRHDASGFHDYEVAQRRRLGFPPFTRLLRLEYRHHQAFKAEEAARSMAARLHPRVARATGKQAAMIGPAPCFFSKLDGRYRWQIVLRGADPGAYLEGLRLSDWRIEADPVSLL